MPTAEYRCKSCSIEYEYHFTVEQWPYVEEFQCVSCGGSAVRYFSAPPAMSPDPHWAGYYDQQLGKYVTSRDEKKRLLARKTPEHPEGLVEVSNEEHSRGVANYKEKEDVIPEGDPKLREAMEKAYADMQAGNIEPVIARKTDDVGLTVVS